jgi:glycosyltransferase involved in cell wall biosynthesis
MKIAFIYDAVYPWVTGGAERRVYELAIRLSSQGHEVHWYSWGWWWQDEGEMDIIYEGIHLHGVGKPMDLYVNDRRSIKEAFYFALKLFPHLMRERFDIVDCQGFPFFSCFTAKLHALSGRSKLVITLLEVWGDYWYHYMGPIGFFGRMVEILTLNLSNRIITISPKTKRDLQNIRMIEDAAVIPPGINFREIMEVEPGKMKWHVIFAGRLIKEKNVDILIRSMALVKKSLPEVNCLIVGEGPEDEKLKKLTESLGLEDDIEFTGFLDYIPDLISRFKSSQVFVLPSKREGFGMVVVEANACGLPVLVIKNPLNAAADLIEPGKNGFIAEDRDYDLADKIISGIQQRQEMKAECIHFAKKYDWDEIYLQLERFYQDSLDC